MPEHGPFLFIDRYFWLICIAVTCLNGFIWWRRAQVQIARNPALEDGYRRLIRGLVVYGNLPWIVMGAGVLSGNVRGIFSYFNAKNGPWVIAWYASIVLIWILCAVWLFFLRGAEQLVEHPGLLNPSIQSPWMIKVFFLVAVAGGMVALAMFVFGDLPSR